MPKDDLSGKNLDNVSLSGEDMEQSDLSGASLRHASLKGARLRDANLAGSDLHDADLQNADLTGADLHDADLTDAHLEGVDLTRAASLESATGLPDAGAEVERHANVSHARSARVDVLDRIDAERAGWDALFEGIPAAWLDLPDALGDWSVRDVIAHLSGWRKPFLDELQAAVQGTAPPLSGWPYTPEEIGTGAAEDETKLQAVNAWLHERSAHRTRDQVLAEAALQWALLRAIVERMPDTLLNDPAAFPRLDGQSLAERIQGGDLFSHFHDEHEPGLHAWLARMRGRPAAG